MSSHGVGRLHIVSGTVKAMDYIEILQNKLLPTARDLLGNQSRIFQDDNAPCHRAKRALHLQWAHEHRAWQADWHQVVFLDESRFNLWDHDGCIRVKRCAVERFLPKRIIKRHSCLTFEFMVWEAISYHGRSNLLRFEGNLNSHRYVREVLLPEAVPFL
ncbi:transposable element Tcb1 transposase [Trichonephila clavipes]|nr:transposable element Tcb1 transposase [Trichonephila clavipes]